MKSYLLILASLISIVLANIADIPDHKVDKLSLPGWPALDKFEMYSGYIAIAKYKQIHYVLLTSQKNGTDDPLVVWMNGGPGCSSMLGMLTENGPYLLFPNTTVYANNEEFSWNKEAHVLYIEQPAGVGFSHCNNEKDVASCTHTDMSQSNDTLEFMKNWYALYPEYHKNDLYISGESYGGIYVPYMTWQIWNYNKGVNDTLKMPIKGMMVGNGVTNWTYDTQPATMNEAYYRSLIDTRSWDIAQNFKCNWTGVPFGNNPPQPECMEVLNHFENITTKINVYNIYAPCWPAQPPNDARFGWTTLGGTPQRYQRGINYHDYTPWLKWGRRDEGLSESGLPPCTFGQQIVDEMNDANIRTELNIPTEYNAPFEFCANTGNTGFHYTMNPKGSQWIWEELKTSDLRLLKYSGDKDSSVPTIGTEHWINALNWPVTTPWNYWRMSNNQVGGYFIEYDNMAFTTVHGAGHMVPMDQPARGYHILFNWLFKRGEFAKSD